MSYGFREGLLASDNPLGEPYIWYAWIHFGWSSAFSGIALTSLITLHYANFKLVRCDRLLYTALSGVVPTLVVFLAFFYLFAITGGTGGRNLVTLYLICAFFVQVIPAFVTPYVYKPILRDLLYSPIKLSILSIVLTVIVALVVLDVITPIFANSSSLTRILIRLVAFPLLIELPAGAVRTAARFWMKEDFPLDRVLTALLGPVVLSSMVGRFLATNMETVWETIGVSILLSAIELLLRVTMLLRDDFYVQCCGRPCGGKSAKRKKGRSENRAWVQFMLFETIFEDVGIFLSLPVALIFRIPPIPGGAPLPVWDVIIRVLIQVAIETLTDICYALGYYFMVSCCGVRYNAITPVEMRNRRRTTMMRFSENRRFLFLPKSVRKLARKSTGGASSAMSSSTDDQSGPRVDTPSKALSKKVSSSVPMLDDAPRSSGAGTPASASTQPPALQVETELVRVKEGSASPTVAGSMTPGPSAQGPPMPEAPEDLPGFFSCSPCCMREDHPSAAFARKQLAAELYKEVRWEDEFMWEPVPLGLVAYQTTCSSVNVQEPSAYGAQLEDTQDKRLRREIARSSGFPGSAVSSYQSSDGASAETPAGAGTVDAEAGLAFDTAIAAANGTEPEQSLDDGFDPSLSMLLTLRMELVALRFLRAWETRFKYFTLILAIGAFGGSLYVMRTFVGSLCPYGDADDPSTWIYDYCTT